MARRRHRSAGAGRFRIVENLQQGAVARANVMLLPDGANRLRYVSAGNLLITAFAMNLKESFIKDYAGHPLRVALNMFLVAATGILIGHLLLGFGLTPRLVFAAMLPALGAIFLAAQWKAERRRPYG